MPLLPRPPRPRTLVEAQSVCLRCLHRLSRADGGARRPFSSTARPNSAVLLSRRQQALRKEYFWANGILDEVLKGARRGVWNHASQEKDSVQGTAAGAAASKIQPVAEGASTSPRPPLEKEELPHRRRKRLRDAAKETGPTAAELAEKPLPPDASSILSTMSQSYSPNSLRRRMTTYLSLSKPRLTFLIVLTTTAAYSIYPVPTLLATSSTMAPSLSTLTLLFLTTGTFLSSSAANTLNMLSEVTHDANMTRTRNRPLVRGLISKRGALVFAMLTGATGVGLLYFGTNPTTAFLGALNIFLYAGVYTPMKRIHTVNTWVGALVGGIPPLMGWVAASGHCATQGGGWEELLLGESNAGGWLMAALLFAWQFPHFNALSWPIRFEYRDAGYKMMAWVNPARNGRVALRYSLLMFPICYGLAAYGVCDWGFVATSSLINSWMAWEAFKFWKHEGHKGTARGLFWASVWQLPIVLVLAMAQKKGLWERVWSAVTGESEDPDDEWEDDDDEEIEIVPHGRVKNDATPLQS